MFIRGISEIFSMEYNELKNSCDIEDIFCHLFIIIFYIIILYPIALICDIVLFPLELISYIIQYHNNKYIEKYNKRRK